MSVWDRRKEILYGDESVCEDSVTTPLSSVGSVIIRAMVVDCVQFIYLFIYLLTWFLSAL